MRPHVTPPISADPDVNHVDFEPHIDSVGTPPKRPTQRIGRYTHTLPRAPALSRVRPHARGQRAGAGKTRGKALACHLSGTER
jgi:hypothetical protein